MSGSDALQVHPNQVAEAHALAVRRGVPTDFDHENRPIFTSQAHRRDYCRVVEGNVHDRNAGYSDPVPR